MSGCCADEVFEIKRHDTIPTLFLSLDDYDEDLDRAIPVQLTLAEGIKLLVSRDEELYVETQMTKLDQSAYTGQVKYAWQVADTKHAGTFRAEVEVTWPGGGTTTFPKDSYFTVVILPDLG